MYLYDTYSNGIYYLDCLDNFSTDYTLLSLSTDEFLTEYLLIIKELVFKYLSLLKPIYQFFWQFPAIIISIIKTIISTWLGFWLLPIAKGLN